ncbi:DedA family protein [Pseudomonas solani]|uniref:DedA family protein n=1 Tax=Pseudomonas TaxID=286 RepID=UPI0021E00289|nr:DedA family protein [Pseudomonas sp. PDM13]MCU9951092.1 DedA family protein [Pseudomonas sp. PDM13]
MDFNLLDLILHLDEYLNLLVSNYGTWIYAILFLVIFCETGLVVMPFLPGDSLLFIAGAICANGAMDPIVLGALLMLAAIMGDSTNYLIGRTTGERLFNKPNSKIFRRDYLQRTHEFYDRHGGKTVTLARFLPIVRTFAPFVAGVGRMPYGRFLAFSVIGTILWVGGLVTLGYFFGNVPFIKQNLSVGVVVIILLSLVPMFIGVVHRHLRPADASDSTERPG